MKMIASSSFLVCVCVHLIVLKVFQYYYPGGVECHVYSWSTHGPGSLLILVFVDTVSCVERWKNPWSSHGPGSYWFVLVVVDTVSSFVERWKNSCLVVGVNVNPSWFF